jgi:hypothetical protein
VEGEPLPDGWVPLDERRARAAEAELKRELHSTHVLYAVPAVALAKRTASDDYLFELDQGRVAQVHLTYAVESTNRWPPTKIFSSRSEWLSTTLTLGREG